MNKIILGINANHADSSACIIKENKLLAAAEEERFNRIKHWAGFPKSSISYCIEEAGIEFSQVSEIAINTNPLSNLIPKLNYFFSNYLFGGKKYEILRRYKKKSNIKKKLFENFGPNKNLKINYIDHHLSHISSGLYPSKFKKCLVISIDGFGDFSSVVIADCYNEKIKVRKKFLFPFSIGVFYETMTQLAGFKKYGEEYKLMGLSSYGYPEYYDFIKKNFFKNNDIFKLNLNLFEFHKNNFTYNFDGEPNQNQLFSKRVYELLKNNNFNFLNKENFSKNIASSAQKIFEEFLFKIVSDYRFDHENLIITGGCAMNSLANGKLAESKLFKNIFVPFCPGDNGGSIGAAIYLHKKKYPDLELSNLRNPYLGKKYEKNEIISILIKFSDKIKYEIINNEDHLNQIVCSKLKDEKIIGWFQDRMEFGSRALGNRSILASPIGPNIKGLINSKIKFRENFRPFAPSILNHKVQEWFKNEIHSDYMSFVAQIKEEKKSIIPAVTHVDGTGRLQTVTEQQNKKFFNLINKFYYMTNVPILLNTSFNENEPIVMKPQEAIECFLRTEMDFLVINNFFISKKR